MDQVLQPGRDPGPPDDDDDDDEEEEEGEEAAAHPPKKKQKGDNPELESELEELKRYGRQACLKISPCKCRYLLDAPWLTLSCAVSSP